MQVKPARVVALSFVFAIVAGTFILLLPYSTYKGISFINALFTATSATCVTGLVVKNTAAYFTPFGKSVILILFQLGGLGIMTFSTIFALVLGRRVSIKNRQALSLIFENVEIDIKVLLKWIFISTFVIELAGALILKAHWPGLNFFYALFHSVSAFCNAGFALFPNSFQGMRSDLLVNILMTCLIIAGGIGFLVLYDLLRWLKAKIVKQEVRLTLHSKIVLSVTAVLIITGFLFLYCFENQGLLKGESFKTRFLTSYFQSVTARTAGFNTVNISDLKPASKLELIALMFIGASPGSTGGGIKTVAFALVVLGIIAVLRGRKQIRIFQRAIPLKLFEKAVVIFILSIFWIALATLLLLLIEKQSFLSLFFEVVSAFGTVGLSCIATANLTAWGKAVIILTMFLGRIGPLTLAIALARREEEDFKLPEENVMVG